MKRELLFFASIIALMTTNVGCNNKDDSSPPPSGQMSAIIGGYNFSATENSNNNVVHAFYSYPSGNKQGNLQIVGDDGKYLTGLTLYYSGMPSSGTFPLDINQSTNSRWGIGSVQGSAINQSTFGPFASIESPNTGTATITSVNQEYHTVSGTFSFKATNTAGSSNVTVSSGRFDNVKLDNWDSYINSGGNGNGNNGGSTGDVMFWLSSDMTCGSISVTCAGITKAISSYYSSGAPSCGASGCATFTLKPGTYSFTASCSNKNWSGNVTVTSNGCYKMQLTGSGNGNNTTGQVMFWTQENTNCGAITVNCGGYTSSVGSYYSSGAPSCGANGCATFTLAPGTYSYTASCSSKNWNGTVTVSSNGCYKMRLLQ
ncbi:MAG: hypothetical protein JSS78_07800 [Bacteroidetes bacterium]|nr:hypothetical protein [Bacteroidota bacterium]